jgi:hypothetical protein
MTGAMLREKTLSGRTRFWSLTDNVNAAPVVLSKFKINIPPSDYIPVLRMFRHVSLLCFELRSFDSVFA